MRLLKRCFIATLAVCLMSTVTSALTITSISPAQNALNVDPAGDVVITFDQTIDAPTVDSSAILVRGNMSGLHPGQFTVVGNQVTLDPDEDFVVGDLGMIVIKRAVKSIGGDSLTNGFYSTFTVAATGGTGVLSLDSIYPAEDIPYYIYGGDLDEDGDMDIATPNEGSQNVSIYLNDGTGKFGNYTEYPSGTISSSVYGDDFDNDGDQDLAVANKGTSDVSVLLNNGDGTFAPQTLYPAGSGTQQIYGGDIDNDGDIDFATSQTGSNDIRMFFNDGTGHFDSAYSYSYPSADPNGIFGGDFNNDGYFDVAAANFNFGTISFAMGHGDGSFTAGPVHNIGSSSMMYGNDFDGDGDLDVIATRNLSDQATFYYNDGTADADTIVFRDAGDYPLGAWCGDLDGDGDPEGMVTNYASGNLSLFMNLGGGVFDTAITIPLSLSGSFAWFHDLDGDGDLDVSAVDEIADLMYVFMNSNVVFEATPRIGHAPLSVDFTPVIPSGSAWAWSFGDGDTSALENPTHVYGPGLFDVRLTVTTVGGSSSGVLPNFVTSLAESLHVSDTTAEPASQFVWDINFTNNVPVTEIILPIRLTGIPATATLDSISRIGTRTDYFAVQQVPFNNIFFGEMVVRLNVGAVGHPPALAPGTGPILKLHLSTDPGASLGETIDCRLDTLGGFGLRATTVTANFAPDGDTSTLTIDAPCNCACHADPVCDSILDVFDVIAAVDEAFRSGPPIVDQFCTHSSRNDTDCSCVVDVFDVVALVDRAFRGVLDPLCDACVELCP